MEEEQRSNPVPMGRRRGLKAALWTILGLWAALMIVLQIALNSAFLTTVVDKVARNFVDGDVEFSSIKASMVRSFPFLNVTIEDFSITYPHDRFSRYDSLASAKLFSKRGRAAEADTLASFRKLSASVNYMSLLCGRIRIRRALLDNPRVFLRQYDSTAANWDLFTVNESEEEDSTASGKIPSISVGKASLEGNPYIMYFNQADTLSGNIKMKSMSLRGRYDSGRRKKKIEGISLQVDSLALTGRLPSDTLVADVSELSVKDRGEHFVLELRSNLMLALKSAGRIPIPFDVDAKVHANAKEQKYSIRELKASLAMIELKAKAEGDFSGENPCLKAEAHIDEEPVREVTRYFGKWFPILDNLKTDAKISLDAHCDGEYSKKTGHLPPLSVHMSIPDASIAWAGQGAEGRFDLDATATSHDGLLSADVKDLCLNFPGLGFSASCASSDLLGDDPLFKLKGTAHAVLDSLAKLVPDSLGISARGRLEGDVAGEFRLSNLSLWNFSKCGLQARFASDGIDIRDIPDTISAHLGKTIIAIEPFSHSDDEAGEHNEAAHDHVGITARIDTLNAEYGGTMFIRGSQVKLAAHNTEEENSKEDAHLPVHGHLSIASIGLRDIDSCTVDVKGSDNVFMVREIKKGGSIVPHISLSSTNKKVSVTDGVNRGTASGLKASLTACPDQVNQNARRKHFLDSLQRILPGIPKDSLLLKAFSRNIVPDYLSERDFVKKDIQIQLGEAMAGYIRDWALNASLSLDEGIFITPYFPLENTLSDLRCSMTNNTLTLSGAALHSGASDLSVSGTLTGLKRALTSKRGRLKLNLGINAGLIDLNEIITAANAGSKFEPDTKFIDLAGIKDSDYLSAIQEKAVLDSVPETSLLVLPSNLEAKVSLNASMLKYSDLETSWLSSDLEMKERCLQVTNTMAMSNMGDVFMEGFYSTRTKKDLKAGFDLTLSNITAEKVIQLFPAVDSIMPMLKAFKGLLDCEMAATASIDTSMNIVLPSVSGIIKIDGKDLALSDSDELNKLRRTLMFKDKDSSTIGNLSVRGIIKDDHLEIFPFILKVDRYTVALNGTQKFDQRFKYHVSAIKSPLPLKFGVNLKGSFDSWRWTLGKAKYKSTKIPLFDDQVDELRFNLLESIHNIFSRGVETVLRQNQAAQEAIENKKAELDYSTEETEDLSPEEKDRLEQAQVTGEQPETSPSAEQSEPEE